MFYTPYYQRTDRKAAGLYFSTFYQWFPMFILVQAGGLPKSESFLIRHSLEIDMTHWQSKSNSSDNLSTAFAVEIYGNSMEIMTFGLHLILLPLLNLVHSSTLLYSMPENQTHQLKKNHRLTTLSQLGKEFKISFDLWVENYHDSNEYNARY